MLPCDDVPLRTPAPDDLVDETDDDDSHPVAFGKYRIHRRIARGGMGEVFLASLVGEFGFEKRLVIKTILRELAQKPRFVEMFAAEAKTAVALSHGNIVPIYELGRAEDTFYIVMGHVDGPSVDRMLAQYREREEPPSLSIALHIVREVLVGLAYAHTDEPGRPAIVHRDITPRNVLVDRSGQVRIVDFGIAMPANVDVKVRAGSTGYMAPEQARAETVDPRADVFSTACMLYELVTLRRAFPKEGVWNPPSLEGVHEGIASVLEAALSADPALRPEDAGAMLSALAPVFATHATVVAGRSLADHLRQLFPDGWELKPTASLVASITPVTRLLPQTYATRLTAVTSLPAESPRTTADPDLHPDAGDAPAAKALTVGAASVSASVAVATGPVPVATRSWASRLLPALGLLAAGAAVAWFVGRTQPGASNPNEERVAASAAEGPSPRPRPEPHDDAAGSLEPSGGPEAATGGAGSEDGAGQPTTSPPPVLAPVHVALGIVPRDAEVRIEGELQDGTPPYSLSFSPDGHLTVEVSKRGFLPQTRTFRAADAGAATIRLVNDAPKGKGFLQVFATGVAWAEVVVDGTKRGATPTRKFELPAGPHRVIVRCVPDVCPHPRTLLSKTVTIRAGETSKVTAR